MTVSHKIAPTTSNRIPSPTIGFLLRLRYVELTVEPRISLLPNPWGRGFDGCLTPGADRARVGPRG
jgi:hypothetical protein